MNLTEEARRLLTCEELRGRVPDEVQKFLRVVAGLEPVAYAHKDTYADFGPEDWDLWIAGSKTYSVPLYTLEPRHDQ